MDKIKTIFKKHRALVMLGIAAIFIGAIIYAKKSPEMVLFYSDSCPHCKNVEAYINENDLKNKIKFAEKEVSNNQANAALLERKARQCSLDMTQGIGVPFFFDGKSCLIGDAPIIDYFQTLK
jgi:glutaredoxin